MERKNTRDEWKVQEGGGERKTTEGKRKKKTVKGEQWKKSEREKCEFGIMKEKKGNVRTQSKRDMVEKREKKNVYKLVMKENKAKKLIGRLSKRRNRNYCIY